MYEKSLLIIKPDGVQRGLAGRILQRFEDSGMKLLAMRLEQAPVSRLEEHYAEHRGKAFFESIVSYMSDGPVIVFVLGGVNAIAKIRQMVGATTPTEALPGTIRGDLAHQDRESGRDRPIFNLIHASANPEDAAREVALWFTPDQVLDYPVPDDFFHGR